MASDGPLHHETVAYSWQLETVIVEHVKTTSRFARSCYDLTYNEFTLLLILMESGKPIAASSLHEFLMVQKETVWDILIRLEDKGFVAKQSDSTDRRRMFCMLSAEGEQTIRKASDDFIRLMREIFIASLPESELRPGGMKSTLDGLRGFSICELDSSWSNDSVYNADFLVFWRVMYEKWRKLARCEGGISFNEYRIIELLDEYEALSPRSIASCLAMQRSGFSLYGKSLIEKGLMRKEADPFDGRSFIVRNTKQGRELVSRLRNMFVQVTKISHQDAKAEEIAVLNAWYMRMYSNLRLHISTK